MVFLLQHLHELRVALVLQADGRNTQASIGLVSVGYDNKTRLQVETRCDSNIV